MKFFIFGIHLKPYSGDMAKPDTGKIFTLDVKQSPDAAIKPAELIQVSGHHNLTLYARRCITVLWHAAMDQGVETGKDFQIEIDDLQPPSHKGYETVHAAIESLMKTILIVKLPNGRTRRVQFLGGNDMDDPDRPGGVLTYTFDKRLIEVLKESTIWGKISIPILMAFTSKYAVTLYENMAQFAKLTHKTFADYTLEEFRDMLGVEPGKYGRFGELNKHVIKPAVAEINALAAFNVSVMPVKKGRSVHTVKVNWWPKSKHENQEAYRELKRPKSGRRARAQG